ncbi:hypothetical protein BpHYR1_026417, partial [Brachionus plicatilis]
PSAKILGGSNYSAHLNQFLSNEDYFEVQKELEILVEQRRKSLTKGTVLTSLGIGVLMPIGGLIAGLVNIPAITGILIQNNSKYSVEYCDSNNFEGYFLSGNGSVAETFGSRHILNPGHSLGFVHTKTQMSGLGASGYITLRICTTYRTLIFVVGWAVNRAKKNRAGLKLYEFENRVDTNDLCLKAEDLLDIEHAGNDGYHHVNKQAFDKIYLNYSFKNQNIMPVGYKVNQNLSKTTDSKRTSGALAVIAKKKTKIVDQNRTTQCFKNCQQSEHTEKLMEMLNEYSL